MIRWAIPIGILAAAAAFFAGMLLERGRVSPFTRVQVDSVAMVREERVDTVVQLRERIVYRTAKPTVVATAENAGRGDVDRFCRQDTVRITQHDTTVIRVAPSTPSLLIRSIRTDAGWFFGPDRIVLTGPINTGDLRQLQYSTRPGWQTHVQGDSLLFQAPRFGLVRELVEAGTYIGLGFLAAKIF